MQPCLRASSRRFDRPSLAVLAAFAIVCAIVAATRGVPSWVALLYAGASTLCFVLYAVDKAAARAGRDRISESTLLSLGFIGGWPGAIVAQQVFRHKTAKRSFRIRFWLSVIVNMAVFVWITTIMARSAA